MKFIKRLFCRHDWVKRDKTIYNVRCIRCGKEDSINYPYL
jgi:hypothetical protein